MNDDNGHQYHHNYFMRANNKRKKLNINAKG